MSNELAEKLKSALKKSTNDVAADSNTSAPPVEEEQIEGIYKEPVKRARVNKKTARPAPKPKPVETEPEYEEDEDDDDRTETDGESAYD